MAPRTLGKTGLKVSPLGFGGRGTSEAGVLRRAFDLGVNFFDTGRMYANSERLIGVAFKDRRKDVIIATKTAAQNKQKALADLDTSLRELQSDYVDIWQYQNANTRPEDVTDEVFEAQQIAKKAGKARFVGITSHLNVPVMLDHMLKRGGCDVMLVGFNFTLPDVAQAIEKARQAGMGIAAIKVLAGGFARIEKSPPRTDGRWYTPGGGIDAVMATLKQDGAMTAAIRYVLRNEFVDTSAVCMADYEQVEANVRAMSQPFTEEDEKLLTAKLAFLAPRYCRMCGTCGGVCDKGVRVSDMLRFLAYAEGYRDFTLARQSYLDLPEHERKIHCADCSSCTVNCPNGVQVRDRLLRAESLFA
jgi:aryl-alcohol dehydrogenase-like predicted oxidoreductase